MDESLGEAVSPRSFAIQPTEARREETANLILFVVQDEPFYPGVHLSSGDESAMKRYEVGTS